MTPAENPPDLGSLPDAVQAQVVAIAARELGQLPAGALPPSLRRVATFAPERRSRLAGAQIAAALESDDRFRTKIAVQIRAQIPEIAEALESGQTLAAGDPAEVAAVAYLLRPEGWVDVVRNSSEVLTGEQARVEAERMSVQLCHARDQLDIMKKELKVAREQRGRELAALKAENADLRRKLGEARSRKRSADIAAEKAREALEEAKRMAAAAATSAEAELRRLRARVDDLERSLNRAQRTRRTERDTETLRARLLLDTLLESVQGLRRELALPAIDQTPADLVEAALAETRAESGSGHGFSALDDPSRLDRLLGLPRLHLILDGYNVTMNGWPDLSLEQQRDRLVGGLAHLAARTSAEITVVFDAAEKRERPLVDRPRGVRVLFSPLGVIADDVIRDLVAAEPHGRPTVVVTGDQKLAQDVVRSGARIAHPAALRNLLSRT